MRKLYGYCVICLLRYCILFFYLFHFFYSEFVFSRQHFFSKKLAKKISEVQLLLHIDILTYVLVFIFIETCYYYAINYHSILVKDSDKKVNRLCFHCSFVKNIAVFLVAMHLRAQFYIII